MFESIFPLKGNFGFIMKVFIDLCINLPHQMMKIVGELFCFDVLSDSIGGDKIFLFASTFRYLKYLFPENRSLSSVER